MHRETIIIGAGPIGIELAANLKRLGLPYLHFEAGSLAQTIYRWPRTTPFFSSPERVAIAGIPLHSIHQSMITGEEYMAYLRSVVEHFDLDIRLGHRVLSLRRGAEAAFYLEVEHRGRSESHSCDRLILAHGNMHRPHRLGIPGEELSHVDHYHDDVHRYFRQKLLIVGGRNSAVEAAIRSWRAGAEVTLLQRKPALEKKRLNSRYHLEISILIGKGVLDFLPNAELKEIGPLTVKYRDRAGGELQERGADFVLLCTGFEKDLSLLRDLGVELDDDLRPNLNAQSMESNVPGVYLAGTAAGGGLGSYKIFVGTSHVHVQRIIKAISGAEALVGDYRPRVYPFTVADIEPVEGSPDR